MGSPAIAAWIAHLMFWMLLAYGYAVGELTPRSAAVFLGVWLLGRVGLSYIPYDPVHGMFPSFVALVDIALVFAVFKGDVRLT